MKKYLYCLLAVLLTLMAAGTAHAESVTLTSYYPVPVGGYDRLRLVPRNEITGACDPGFLYYWENNGLQVCNDAGAYSLLSPWSQSGDNIFPVDTAANPDLKVGIGTQSPPFRLSLDTDAVNPDGGIWAEGTYTTGAAVGNPGAGTRLVWYPAKAAFRAGQVDGAQWDDNNIGNSSVALGYSTTASGPQSTALGVLTTASGSQSTTTGVETVASGIYSTAMGYQSQANGNWAAIAMGYNTRANSSSDVSMGFETVASGGYSTAMGYRTTASGSASTAMGLSTTASGTNAAAMGEGTTAQPYAALVVGRYNIISGNPLLPVTTDPIFVVGNGTNALFRSNALTVLKNGNTGINVSSPQAALHVNSVMKLQGRGAPPQACTLTDIGLLYVDNTLTGALCFCDGAAWQVAAGTGTCN